MSCELSNKHDQIWLCFNIEDDYRGSIRNNIFTIDNQSEIMFVPLKVGARFFGQK